MERSIAQFLWFASELIYFGKTNKIDWGRRCDEKCFTFESFVDLLVDRILESNVIEDSLISLRLDAIFGRVLDLVFDYNE